jgi:hypothetical protein
MQNAEITASEPRMQATESRTFTPVKRVFTPVNWQQSPGEKRGTQHQFLLQPWSRIEESEERGVTNENSQEGSQHSNGGFDDGRVGVSVGADAGR